MVARTPPKLKKIAAAIDPVLLRETLKKVDRCMARLQELQYTVAGGRKVVSGVSLSPRSTRGYLKTSLRCKQESLRIKSAAPLRSPIGKFPPCSGGEWRRMSLPAMLVGETVGEILQATQFAREVLAVVSNKNKPTLDEPKTPMTQGKSHDRFRPENTELISKRKKEKQNKARESNNSPPLQRARSRINFKVSPPKVREVEKENGRYLANRVSPRNKPWARKAVLFPNPLFLSTPTKQQQKFCKTRSPVIPKKRETQTPHKFLIKSPQKHNSSNSKFQVKIKSPPKVSLSPVRNSAKTSITASKLRRSFSPANLRRSFSPSKIANRLMSPLKGRKSLEKKSCDGLLMSGLKQRPAFTPIQFSNRRTQATGYC